MHQFIDINQNIRITLNVKIAQGMMNIWEMIMKIAFPIN